MPSHEFDLAPPPDTERSRELWLQQAVGFVLFEDVRRYAMNQIPDGCEPHVREAAERGIDAAVYGLMRVIDGVSGSLSNDRQRVELQIIARHVCLNEDDEDEVLASLDLASGDGMCTGYHRWLNGDFGADAVAFPAGR